MLSRATGEAAGDAPAGRRRGIFENTFINILGVGGAHGLSALTGFITAKVLGASGVGVLAVSFGLIEFGRALSSFTNTPSILEYHRGRDAKDVFGTSFSLKLVGSFLFAGMIALAAPTLAEIFNIPAWAVVLAAVVLLLSGFYEVGSAKLEADNRMIRRNVLLATGPAVGLVLVATLALLGHLTILTSILSTITAVAIMGVASVIHQPALYRPRLHRDVAAFFVRYGSRIVAAGLLAQGLLWTDTLMVSYLRGNAATGVYSVVFQLTYVMVTASVAMSVALVPALSELAGRGERTAPGFQRGTLIALGMSSLISLFFLVAGRFILQLYGPSFVVGYPALLVLLTFGIAASLAVPASSMLTVHGHAGWLTAISLTQLALNVPLNYVLITRFGITGAAIATSSVFLAGTLMQWVLVRLTTGASPWSRETAREALDRIRDWTGRQE